MDESILLDLLECPVCLERLDATAKVLPCQHTFCRRCLQGILNSRSELRCPECRTLVGCGVDELPTNILLVRLLDGIKHRPRRPGSSGVNGNNNINGTARVQGDGTITTTNCGTALRDLQSIHRVQARSPPVRGIPQLPCAKALYNYEGKEPGDLKFNKGDIIILRRQVDENWYHGEVSGVHGFFPTNFVQIIKPLPQPPPQCKALYDFEVKDKEADKDCLPFSKDDILTVIRRVDENWAEGMLGDKIGIFPISYVEVHISTTGLIVTSPPSSPVNSVAPCVFPLEGTYSVGSGENHPPPTPPPPLNAVVTTSASSTPRPTLGPADQVVAHPRPQVRPNMYIALYPYTPRKEDELELRKGEIFLVLERCQDGWFKGTSMHTGKIGVFPGNYMALVTRAPSAAGQPNFPVVVTAQVGRGVTTVLPVMTSQPKAPGNGLEFSRPVSPTPPIPTAVVSAAHVQATNPQAKVLMHMTGQMTVNQARNAVRTAAAQGQERPTAAVTPIQAHNPASTIPPTTVAPQQPVSLQHPQQAVAPFTVVAIPTAARPGAALTSATAAITPPNVNATSLEGEPTGNTACVAPAAPATPPVTASAANKFEKESREKKEKKGFLKLLSSASTKRKSRPSPPSSPTLESEQAAAETFLQGAVGPEVPSSISHGRAGSCPVDTEAPGATLETLHRKTASLDSGVPIAPPPRQPCSSMASVQLEAKSVPCERYRVVVSYPPQSEAELELKDGDIVFVHKKREDGWFKGTLQRNGKTGLFPGSFVESL
ncbi:E3 ubiquitin-protein ligase SH3RF1 isoform X3 [Scyliorhinus canicula]|uniref:E3 ubiquitin-protein ligase SH3RF1 isoform X3 n=1 Tax=Scyliorhinus canicula TaxID=7830 RepID=UPI0018F7913C|nr:E3 ubiquitin-protein ligase SH3RF1 isoform X3 [Scyliorhinus canicula]